MSARPPRANQQGFLLSAGAVSDVEMQEHYDEFFEVREQLWAMGRLVTPCVWEELKLTRS